VYCNYIGATNNEKSMAHVH